MRKVALLISSAALLADVSALSLDHAQSHVARSEETIVPIPMSVYKKDCWMKRPVAARKGAAAALMSLTAKVPGAGIDPFEPFQTVEKDGFMEVACVKDYMYSYGDKFGDNKFSYKLADTANVSIVHYDAHVAREDRQPMTQKVCFEFCRTVPHMSFFGITNGRSCYCAPYFKKMESGSSNCDAVCEGETTLMCGGKEKSSIFSMHMCASTASDLADRAGLAEQVKDAMGMMADEAKDTSKNMQDAAASFQESFGKVGDSAATGLMQKAKVFSGDLLHKAEAAEKIASKLGELEGDAKAITNFEDPTEVTKAERLIEDIDATLASGEDLVTELDKMKELAMPTGAKANASAQYYPVMYFVDKEVVSYPSTCGGKAVAKPIVGTSKDGCATACDKAVHDCIGFGYFEDTEKLCFLYRKFETAFVYKGCEKGAAFLSSSQASKADSKVTCYAKFSKFEGTTLKPDGSGKCKQCFKKVTMADRCFK